MTKPSDDHALLHRALERWKASGRSRDALARRVGVDRTTFARWTSNPQCTIRTDAQRAVLQGVAEGAMTATDLKRIRKIVMKLVELSVLSADEAAWLYSLTNRVETLL